VVTTRRGFLWLCGGARALASTRFTERCVSISAEDGGGLEVAGGGRAAHMMSPADKVVAMGLAEETRKVLAAMTPSQWNELRKRHGVA